jgi:hypothetical protein
VRSAAVILFEVNCQLLLGIFRVMSYASDEDYSWVKTRFGVTHWSVDDRTLKGIVETLRADVVPSYDALVETLTGHLNSRVEDLRDSLDFVVANSGIPDREDALLIAQAMAAVSRGEFAWERDPHEYNASWSLDEIGRVEEQIVEVASANDRLGAFAAFSGIEERLEPIEKEVEGLVILVDRAIQDEIDRTRGK